LDTTAKVYSKIELNNLTPSLREKRNDCTIPVKPVEQLLTRYKIKLGVIWASKYLQTFPTSKENYKISKPES
jgi:hypothetical protein